MANKKATPAIDYAVENPLLRAQLTKRNEEYVYSLDKALAAADVVEMERNRLMYELMTQLIEGQKTGKTARQLFGTVSQQAQKILSGPGEQQVGEATHWQTGIVNGLLFAAIFVLASAYQVWQNPDEVAAIGVSTMVLNYVMAILMMTLLSKYMPKPGQKKINYLKYAGLAFGWMIVWFVAILLFTQLPTVVNPVLPPLVNVVIGAATIALRFYWKRKWQVRTGLL